MPHFYKLKVKAKDLKAIYNLEIDNPVKPLHETILEDFNMGDTYLSTQLESMVLEAPENTEPGIPVRRKLQIDNILEYCIKIKEQTEAARRLITESFPSY